MSTIADLLRERIEKFRERAKERPLLTRVTKRIEEFRGQYAGTTPETLTEAQKRLMEEFRRGIAEALGVPPEAIKEEPLQKWIIEWTKAWVKPEYLKQIRIRASTVYELGYHLGRILRTQYAELKPETTETAQGEVASKGRSNVGGIIY